VEPNRDPVLHRPSAYVCRPEIPARSGVGLKLQHCADLLSGPPEVGWLEIHAENYMGAGGPPHHNLTKLRDSYPLSVHGVGLSIGADHPLDRTHLGRLAAVVERYEPGLVSEHLAWSSHGGNYYPDLLPVPYTRESLDRVAMHVEQVQEHLRQPILLENPSTYLAFESSTMTELEFIQLLTQRTGCGLLLDVNNVIVSAINQGYSAEDYVSGFPLEAVREIHLAGHAEECDESGAPLLIDTHDRPVAKPVWDLFHRVIERTGPLPTLIEWDSDVPDWPVLLAEAKHADSILETARVRVESGGIDAAQPEDRRGALHGIAS
jgi:uncharacterized protein (UPF0276 family)